MSVVFSQVLNLVNEIPDNGTVVSKYGGVVEDHTYESVFELFFKLVLYTNINQNSLNGFKIDSFLLLTLFCFIYPCTLLQYGTEPQTVCT
jgi:hypothetical protein